MTSFQRFADLVTLGEPIRAHGHSVFPLFRMRASPCRFLTLGQALDLGVATVDEVEQDEVPWFRRVEVGNVGELPILILDGDLLEGGRQDRVADRPFWVPAHTRAPVPVSCVEANRCSVSERADLGTASSMARPELRAARMVDHPDQGATWDRVAEARAGLVPGGSLAEARRGEPDLTQSFPFPVDATGLVVVRRTRAGPRIVLVEWLADADAFRAVRGKLLRSALDASLAGRKPPRVSRTEVRKLFKGLGSIPCTAAAPLPALVQRLDSPWMRGWATDVDSEPVHVVVCPA